MQGLAQAVMQDFTFSQKPLILVLYKTYHPKKIPTSLLANTIVSVGEGLIHLHDPTAQLL